MGAARRKRERRVIRGDPLWARRKSQRHLRDGGLERESDRGVRASRPGNSGGAKAPDFRRACEVGEDRGDWRSACKTPTTIRSRPNKLYGKAKATPIGRRRGPAVKSVGKPDASIGHVRFDERGRETERLAKPQAAAPFLDSTGSLFRLRVSHHLGRATFSAPASLASRLGNLSSRSFTDAKAGAGRRSDH